MEDAGRDPSDGAHRGRADAVQRPAVRRRGLERGRAAARIRAISCCTFRGSVAALDIASGRIAVEELHRARGAAADRARTAPACSNSGLRAPASPPRRPSMRSAVSLYVGDRATRTTAHRAVADRCGRRVRSCTTASCAGSSSSADAEPDGLAAAFTVLAGSAHPGERQADHSGRTAVGRRLRPRSGSRRRDPVANQAGAAADAAAEAASDMGRGRRITAIGLCRRSRVSALSAATSGSLAAHRYQDAAARAGTRHRADARLHLERAPAARMRRRRRSRSSRAARSPDRWTAICAPTRPSTARCSGTTTRPRTFRP